MRWPFGGIQQKDQRETRVACHESCYGLENFGNTCYCNSIIQALYACRPFRERLLSLQDPLEKESVRPDSPSSMDTNNTADASSESDDSVKVKKQNSKRSAISSFFSNMNPDTRRKSSKKPSPNMQISAIDQCDSEETMLFATRRLFSLMNMPQRKKLGFYSPKHFIQRLKASNEMFRNANQHDAHEFFNFIMNDLNETLSISSKEGNMGSSCIKELFQGTLSNETKCLGCEHVSRRKEHFIDLSIDIDQNTSLTAAINRFSNKELMNQGNKFYCDICRCRQEAERSMRIQYSPPILVLHLKRFKYVENLGRFLKLNYRVPFPVELKLSNFSDDSAPEQFDQLYHLVSIVVHIGNGPNQGHYVTVTKRYGRWLLFDDDQVQQIEEEHISSLFGQQTTSISSTSTETAYILFYSRIIEEASTKPITSNVKTTSHSKSSSLSKTKYNHKYRTSLAEQISFSSSS